MANKQVNLKDSQANNLIPNTTTSAVADVAKGQALSQTLANTPDKDTLGYEVFSDSEIYTKGDVVYYQNKLYKFKQFHAAGSWNAGHVDAYSVSDIDDRSKGTETLLGNDELETTAQTVTGAVNELKGRDDLQDTQITALADTKADKNGVYPQMIVGSAENLVGGNDTSRVLTLDTAGGTADIATGIAIVVRIKGNSLVWNQLCLDPNFTDTSKWNPYSLSSFSISENIGHVSCEASTGYTGLRFYVQLISGHKYIYGFQVKSDNGEGGTVSARFLSLTKTALTYKANSFTKYRFIDTYTGNSGNIQGFIARNRSDSAWAVQLKNFVIFDLTQMFGAGNEPATVAEFEALYPKSYYDYNDGEIINLLPSGIKTVGFNAYNHSTGKAVLLGGNQYQISGTYTSISYTDINGNEETITTDIDGIFTPTNNGTLTVVGGNSTNTCVHLVWSGIRNGEYEPYQESTRTLPNVQHINTDGTITESAEGKTRLFPDGLCSAGSGNNYKCDEITVERAIKFVGTRDYAEGDESDTTLTTDGVKTNYPLATPTEVVFDEPLNLNYQVNDFGTEQMLPESTSEPTTAPLSMDVVYGLNVVDFVRNAPKNYISKESMTNFLTELGTAMGGTWSMTWNATTEKYDFDFTATPEPESEPEA